MPRVGTIKSDKKTIEKERSKFRSLLVANPNYFGNLENTSLKPVKAIASNTSYEQLMCVGLYPEFDLLEAIVYIKKEGGYGGDICSKGTPEYVRFYLSYDNGVTWKDQGVTSFQAQDVPGKKPLEYAVQLKIQEPKKRCQYENLPKVRAILSWNMAPPADTPNFIPVWGNVVNGTVQINPLTLLLDIPINKIDNISLVDLLKDNNLIDKDLTLAQVNAMDLTALKKEVADALVKGETKALSAIELHKLYEPEKISASRYLYPALKDLSLQKATNLALPVPGIKKNYFPGLDIDISDIIDIINDNDGNTGYEELGCIGLNTTNDNLEGTIKVKKSAGYLGGLCTKGSREYVAFWMDFGAGWEYVGTSSVRVHDINAIPRSGLDYAVTLPVNLAGRRKSCKEGPVTARVRAIMSWETAPDPTDPDWKPVWGNREETLVLITPGDSTSPNTHPPFIETVGGMAVEDIDGNGLANGAAVTAGFSAHDSPFGGVVVLAGHLAYPPNTSVIGVQPLEYQILVKKVGDPGLWQPLTNSFALHRSRLLDGIWSFLPVITQAATAAGWYTYYEDITGGPGDAQTFVTGNILGRWQTSAAMDGKWEVKVASRVRGTAAPIWESDTVTVMLDNVAPTVDIDISTGGGVCADFTSGTPIGGTFSAFDDHFGSYRLSLVPAAGGSFTVTPSGGGSYTQASPFSRAYTGTAAGVSGSGESGGWTLDTTSVPACGYVIYVEAWDRTIVNSGGVGFYNAKVVGLCIRP